MVKLKDEACIFAEFITLLICFFNASHSRKHSKKRIKAVDIDFFGVDKEKV